MRSTVPIKGHLLCHPPRAANGQLRINGWCDESTSGSIYCIGQLNSAHDCALRPDLMRKLFALTGEAVYTHTVIDKIG